MGTVIRIRDLGRVASCVTADSRFVGIDYAARAEIVRHGGPIKLSKYRPTEVQLRHILL